MIKWIMGALGALAVIACGTGVIQTQQSNTELVVEYRGKEVSRRGGRYIGENELKRLLNRGKETIVVFAADWCPGCDVARKAINSAGFKVDIHWINVDEEWAQALCAAMGINQVPLMFHVGRGDKTMATRLGAGPIVLYLTLNY